MTALNGLPGYTSRRLLRTLKEQKIGMLFFLSRALLPELEITTSRTARVPTAIYPKSISALSIEST